MKSLLIILLFMGVIWSYLFFYNNNEKKSLETKSTNSSNLEEAYFAWGCFWCMEGIFEAQEGVIEAIAWYAGGKKETANYGKVSSWETKHREWVKIIYNPDIISFEKLSELFWTQIDPTDPEGQFADKWFHYTTALFYNNETEKSILEKSKKVLEESGKFDKKIVTKILPFTTFFKAEEYHQDYYKKSSLKYSAYKKWSGRKDFIEDNWKDRIDELEKEDIKNNNKWYKNYSTKALKNSWDKDIVLFFHADWCSTCKSFEKKVLSEKIPENILILKVDFDSNLELRKKYNIVTQTSFVLVDNKWNLKKRWIWARWIKNITDKIEEYENSNKEVAKVYTKEELKARLTPLQYKVTQEGGTEKPFENKYWDNKKEWIYVDIVDRTALFSSTDKFESGTGWPAFTKPIDENFLTEENDYSLFWKRTEIKSGSSHLWHVFEDGPSEKGGLRYCINSAALDFVPKNELKGTKYERYLNLFN